MMGRGHRTPSPSPAASTWPTPTASSMPSSPRPHPQAPMWRGPATSTSRTECSSRRWCRRTWGRAFDGPSRGMPSPVRSLGNRGGGRLPTWSGSRSTVTPTISWKSCSRPMAGRGPPPSWPRRWGPRRWSWTCRGWSSRGRTQGSSTLSGGAGATRPLRSRCQESRGSSTPLRAGAPSRRTQANCWSLPTKLGSHSWSSLEGPMWRILRR
mmetsp:Transcript_99735/g.171800  ORF Transcript_99735/g.171800 Transcript_99735/m.171800 type:complete len:210 (-) Transcript_99735:2408-3037(-)